jgi:hypothetical protein
MIPEYDDLVYIASFSTSHNIDDDYSFNSNINYTLLHDKCNVQSLQKLKSNKDYNCLTSFLDLPPIKNASNILHLNLLMAIMIIMHLLVIMNVINIKHTLID